jgi:SAM-dependent methyltransferase
MTRDLHQGFRDPRRVAADELVGFLEEADRLPGFGPVRRAMRRALDLRPGMRLLDAGCGIGLETERLAAVHPATLVTGLDRNAGLLAVARRRADPGPPNLGWPEADLAALELADGSFDAVRTERVLMYLPDGGLARVLDDLIGLLRPGGRLALFELDYGATILPELGHDAGVVRHALAVLERSVPEPWIGRRLPGLLADRGIVEVEAAPYSFAVSAPVWRRIVRDTLLAEGEGAAGAFGAWLDAHREGGFLGGFTGILVTGRVAGR